MKPSTIWYERKFNLGNYETATLGCEVTLDEGESALTSFPKLQAGVQEAYERIHGAKSLGRLGKQSGLTTTQMLNKELTE